MARLRSVRRGRARAHQSSGDAQRASDQRRGGHYDARDYSRFRCLREGDRKGHAIRPTAFDAATITIDALKGKNERMLDKLRIAMLVHGVDLKGYRGGLV